MAPTGQAGKGGQTEAETFWKKRGGGKENSQWVWAAHSVKFAEAFIDSVLGSLNIPLFAFFFFIIVLGNLQWIFRHLVIVTSNFKRALKWYSGQCVSVNPGVWMHFKLPAGPIFLIKKIKRFFLLQSIGTRLWSDFSVLVCPWPFRSGLDLVHFHPHSLGNPSICIFFFFFLLTYFLSPSLHSASVLEAWSTSGAFASNQHSLIHSVPMVIVSVSTPSHTLPRTGSFRFLSWKKKKKQKEKPKWLSISFLLGHENYGFPKWIVYRSLT